jgi:hypothetical protein
MDSTTPGQETSPSSLSHVGLQVFLKRKPDLAVPAKVNGDFFFLFLPREKQLLIDLYCRPRTPRHPPPTKLLLIKSPWPAGVWPGPPSPLLLTQAWPSRSEGRRRRECSDQARAACEGKAGPSRSREERHKDQEGVDTSCPIPTLSARTLNPLGTRDPTRI